MSPSRGVAGQEVPSISLGLPPANSSALQCPSKGVSTAGRRQEARSQGKGAAVPPACKPRGTHVTRCWLGFPSPATAPAAPARLSPPQRGPQIGFPGLIRPGESLQTWPTSPSLQPFHRDIRPALRQVSTEASPWAPANTSAREASTSHFPQAQGMQALCWAGTRPSRNQIWAAPEPKITCQLPGKRGEPSVHRSRTCQEGSHLHPSSGITGVGGRARVLVQFNG